MTRAARLVPLVVAAAALVALLPALGAGFVNWDDEASFLRNPHYRGLGLDQLTWMFTTTLLGHWSPLTWVTWGLDYTLGGLAPFGYHLTSLLLHAANTALLYIVARRLLAAAVPGAPGPGLAAAAAFAALVFGVHPLRAESVAWVSERRDVLCAFFYLLAVAAYLRGAGPDAPIERRWWGLSLAAFVAALLSKAMAMTLPVTLLVLDAYPLRRRALGAGALLVEKLPYAALAAGAAAMAVVARQEGGNLTGYDQYGAASRVALAGYTFWFYPWKLVWPAGLSPMYELPSRVDPLAWRFLGPLAAVVAVTAVLVVSRRQWPGALAAWLHSMIVLAPIAGIVHSGAQLAHDRYSYLSGMGFAVLAGAVFLWTWRPAGVPWARPLAGAAAAAVVGALGAAAWAQSGVWHSSETLWRHAVAVDPGCSLCESNLGRVVARPGRFPEAEAHVRRAIALRPDRPGPRENMGLILLAQGRPREAEDEFRQAVAIRPSASSRNNLGVALASQGRDAEAEAELREAERLSARLFDAPGNLGALYVRQGRYADAIPPLRRALVLDPGQPGARANLARALNGRAVELRESNPDEAARLLGEAAAVAR